MLKRQCPVSPLCAVALTLASLACAQAPDGAPEAAGDTTERSALVGGTVNATQNPNVLFVGPTTGVTGCTGTLIAGQWVLTAGHCTSFFNSNSFQSPAAPGMNVYVNGTVAGTSQAVFNMSPQLVASAASLDTFAASFNATPTHNGTSDIALIMLTAPIPDPTTQAITSLVSLATSMPTVGATVTTWGEGDTHHPASPNGGPRNFLTWPYSATLNTSSCPSYDPNCAVLGGYSHGFINPGDSGGPSFMNGNETIFGVNSGIFAGSDKLGDVEYFRPQLCNLMYNHPHRFCATGTPLGGEPGGCGPFASGTSTNVTTYVVNEDPYCGTNWWDDQCVNEAIAVTSWTDQYSCWAKKGSTYDGYSDIVLAGNFAGSCVPQALSEGNGTFYGWSHNYDNASFSGWASSSGVTALAGDFDGDGFSDIALINSNASSPWGSIPVAFLNAFTDLNMHVTNTPIGGITGVSSFFANPFACGGSGAGFAAWASACTNAVPVAGDFDGDGKTDIALVGSDYFMGTGTGNGALPVAFSNGDGSFRVSAIPDVNSTTYHSSNSPGAAAFQNAKGRGAVPVVGDFDGDGKSDIAWVGGEDGTGRAVAYITIAFSNGDGTFRTVNATVPYNFQKAATGGQKVVGDFNGDGLADIAVTGSAAWNTTIPIAFSNGNTASFGFTWTNSSVATFPGLATTAGAKAVAGDFNGDGLTDIALTGVSAWSTIPVALSSGGGNFSVTNSALDPNSPLSFPVAAATAGSTPLGGGY